MKEEEDREEIGSRVPSELKRMLDSKFLARRVERLSVIRED